MSNGIAGIVRSAAIRTASVLTQAVGGVDGCTGKWHQSGQKLTENGTKTDRNAVNHRIPAKRANSLLKYSALWTQPCCPAACKPAAQALSMRSDAKRRRRYKRAIAHDASKSGTEKITDSLE